MTTSCSLTGLVRMLAEHVDVLGTAASGEEALELVDRKRPRVVLMDLNLPGMSGVDAIRRLNVVHQAYLSSCSR